MTTQPRFITIATVLSGLITIAIDNIASVESNGIGSKIVLKQIKEGSNVEVFTAFTVPQVNQLISSALST